MPELLIEFFSEEIPARMQKRAEEDFARLLGEKLKAAGLSGAGAETFSGPRRLALRLADLPAATPDVSEERKGPRVGAPAAAIQGFLKSAGLARIEDAQVQADPKGDFYVARIEKKGAETAAVLAEALPEIIRAFPWPKSMRTRDADWTWVRPLRNIACVFGGAHVPIPMPGVRSEPITWGHRVHAAGAIEIADFASYREGLRSARVMIDREERKALILRDARAACAARKLELVEDVGLLEEVAGLAEWPVVLLGDMDPDFLSLPGEVIRLSMRTHQKYFAVRDPKSGALAPHFVVVANIEASDGGAAIAAGNARVLSARLNDARFFWETDRRTPLFAEAREAKLKQIVFHQKLGSVWGKVERVRVLAKELAPIVWDSLDVRHSGASRSEEPGTQGQAASPVSPWVPDRASRVRNDAMFADFLAAVDEAARLCKMDLVTETVGEFPELQGQVGRQLYLAELNAPSPQGAGESIAQAIEDHYRPLGPNDRVPTDPVAVTVALADKLDTLVGFWAIDEKPTGSSDPFALRRAALGLASVIRSNAVRMELSHAIRVAFDRAPVMEEQAPATAVDLHLDLLAFLADRLKVQLREQGKRHDLVDAVFALGDDDLVRIVARVEALDTFLKTEDGQNLLAGYRRAANILRAEEKKNKDLSTVLKKRESAALQLQEVAEKSLHAALKAVRPEAEQAVQREDFAGAMAALARLRGPVDQFFESVLVNAEEESVRLNRLLLLFRVRAAIDAVADFSKVEG